MTTYKYFQTYLPWWKHTFCWHGGPVAATSHWTSKPYPKRYFYLKKPVILWEVLFYLLQEM